MSHVTGEQLYDELVRAAGRAGRSISAFAAPIFSDTWKLEQLRIARTPKATTIERVRALIEGRPIPDKGSLYVRDPRAFGMSRAEAEAAGIPPSQRSLHENQSLAAVLERKRRAEQLLELAEVARETRRPGQCLADRVRELRREMAAA